MAIYFNEIKSFSRADTSLSAKSAYITGERLKDNLTGEIKYYRDKEDDVLAYGVKGVEGSLNNKDLLQEHMQKWNKADKAINACFGFQNIIAIPKEWNLETAQKAMDEYCRNGSIYAIHLDKNNPDNIHAHVLEPLRDYDIESGQFAKKKRRFSKGQLASYDKSRKKDWEEVANKYLSVENQIDHRSYKAQGSERLPQVKEGYKAREMERRGEVSELCQINREIKEYNRTIGPTDRELKWLQQEFIPENESIFERIKERFDEIAERIEELLDRIKGLEEENDNLSEQQEEILEELNQDVPEPDLDQDEQDLDMELSIFPEDFYD